MSSPALAEAYAVGIAYEAGLDDGARRRGAHYTPPDVAAALVERALAAWEGPGHPVVCDPSCGGGVFLVAAAEALVARGVAPVDAVERHLVGVDVDPGAVAVSRRALRRWVGRDDVAVRVEQADALASGALEAFGVLDVVVGNPPFQGQLVGTTARTRRERDALVARFGAPAGGYVDQAALFLLLAREVVGDGGVIALIQPRSFLVARDAAAVRSALLDGATPVEVWLPLQPVFAAGVDVCAPVVVSGRAPGRVRVTSGRLGDTPHADLDGSALIDAPTWSAVWASAHGVPTVAACGSRVVGDVATATAGFRDQYYGLLPHLRDAVDDPPAHPSPHPSPHPFCGAACRLEAASRTTKPVGRRVVTTKMVDPGVCAWGDAPVTIARARWAAPWVDAAEVAAATPSLGAWIDRLASPKVLVATQTKVIEAVADADGDAIPLTPLIAVVPSDGTTVHEIEAALLAPAATAWALGQFGGGGLSSGALKLAASQVLQLPLPVDRDAWLGATAMLAATPVDWPAFGAAMNASWGLDDDDLLQWWLGRLPRNVRSGPAGSLH